MFNSFAYTLIMRSTLFFVFASLLLLVLVHCGPARYEVREVQTTPPPVVVPKPNTITVECFNSLGNRIYGPTLAYSLRSRIDAWGNLYNEIIEYPNRFQATIYGQCFY